MEVIRKEWIECEGRLGAPMLVAHRVDLHSALKRHAVSEDGSGIPAVLRNQVKVVLFEPEKGLIHLEDGTVEHGDLIIAADGVRSSAASIMISTELILNDPVTAPLLDGGPNDAGFYVSPGHDGYLVRYPCRESTLQNFGLYTLADPKHTNKQEWKFPMDREYLRQQMHGFSPVLLRLCDLAPEISLWRLPGRKPIAKFQRGKMVAIGDAAHPM
jgi:salicylate hydroxylase